MRFFSSLRKQQVPVIYTLGWWAYQHLLEIHTFEIEIEKSQLNVMNSKSTIRYTVKGILKAYQGGLLYIKAVHHSEQLLYNHDIFSFEEKAYSLDAHIYLTPVVGIKYKKATDYTENTFEFTNFYELTSLHWGDNFIRFSCGDIDKEVCLQQRK